MTLEKDPDRKDFESYLYFLLCSRRFKQDPCDESFLNVNDGVFVHRPWINIRLCQIIEGIYTWSAGDLYIFNTNLLILKNRA